MKINLLYLFSMLWFVNASAQNYDFISFVAENKNNINDYADFCLQYFGEKPYSDDYGSQSYEIISIRNNFVCVLSKYEIAMSNKSHNIRK